MHRRFPLRRSRFPFSLLALRIQLVTRRLHPSIVSTHVRGPGTIRGLGLGSASLIRHT